MMSNLKRIGLQKLPLNEVNLHNRRLQRFVIDAFLRCHMVVTLISKHISLGHACLNIA